MAKIYIGNLNFITTEETLTEIFSKFGDVTSSTIIKDKFSGNSKGFGFVEMEDETAAGKAVSVLTGKEVDGRKIRVNFAEDKSAR